MGRWVLVAVLVLSTVVVARQVWTAVGPLHDRKLERRGFYDMRLWRGAVGGYLDRTGSLYDTESEEFFLPGSHARYKYPPCYGGFLRLFRDVARLPLIYAWIFLGIYVATLALILWESPSRSWIRWWIAALAFAQWQPIFETWNDLAMEGVLLGLLGGAAVGLSRGRAWLWGGLVGVAAGIKVYPAALAALCLTWRWHTGLGVRSRPCLMALIGAAGGLILTILFGMLVFPPRVTFQFWFEILPHIGGVSLSLESVSLLSAVSRTVAEWFGLFSDPSELDLETLEQLAPAGFVSWLPWAVWGLVLGSLGFLTLRRFRSSTPQFLAGICLLMAALPTSWGSYQAVLVVPWIYAVLRLPPLTGHNWQLDSREHVVLWMLSGAVFAAGSLNTYHDLFWVRPELSSWARTLVPFLIWGLLFRLECGGIHDRGVVTESPAAWRGSTNS